LFTSVAILTELASKLREKFDWNEERIRIAKLTRFEDAGIVNVSTLLRILGRGPETKRSPK
jgi:hypothetical protein